MAAYQTTPRFSTIPGRLRRLSLCCFVAVATSSSHSAAAIQSVTLQEKDQRVLRPLVEVDSISTGKQGRPRVLTEEIRKGLDLLVKASEELLGFSGSIDVALNADDAGAREHTKFQATTDLARGIFPRELRLSTAASVQSSASGLREEITTLLFNYDYHPTTSLELFTFGERFTDDFLSIRQRIETGVGAKLEIESGLTPKGTATDSARRRIARAGLRDIPDSLELRAAKRLSETLEAGIPKRYARVQLGLSAALFWELEQPQLEVVLDTLPGSGKTPRTVKMDLGTDQRSRLSLRPSVLVRPSDQLTFKGMIYWKLPLDEVKGDRNRFDYRMDMFASAAASLSEAEGFSESAELVLEVKRYYDNLPPFLSPAMVAAFSGDGFSPNRTSAERQHTSAALKVRVRWK